MLTRTAGLVLATLGALISGSEAAAPPARVTAYVVMPPDVLALEVTGLPAKARAIRGEFLVRLDGTIGLGEFGSVHVVGLTLDQIRAVVARHLAPHAENKGVLRVRCRVAAFNSKSYFVVSHGKGDSQIFRFPFTGGETVVDAVAKRNGRVAIELQVWVIRSSGKRSDVDWRKLIEYGGSGNLRLEPGDRVHVGGGPSK